MNGPVGPAARAAFGEARPARVVRLLEGELAIVEVAGALEEVCVALVDPAVGDTVLVHGREAVTVLAYDTGGHGLGGHDTDRHGLGGHDTDRHDTGGHDLGGRGA